MAAYNDPAMHSQPPAGAAAPPATQPQGTSTTLWLLRIARWLVLFAYAIAIIALVVLTIAFFLHLFGASTSAPFVQWIYRSEDRFMKPFRGIFPPVEVSEQSVLDVSVLFAILMYGLFAVAIHALVEWLTRKLHAAQPAPPPVAGQRW
jgi:uncharacterized protein YggT (Ycf19 family)